ncbi:MAG: hypothetical protein ACYS9H_08625, partial [Planctomycetota bacterium]
FPIYYDVNGCLLKKEVIKIGRFGFTADAVSSLKYEPRIARIYTDFYRTTNEHEEHEYRNVGMYEKSRGSVFLAAACE